MFARITFVFVLLVPRAAWSQVEPGATGGFEAPDIDTQLMMTPPPVSGQAYPNTFGSETRSNYLLTSLTVNGGYAENVLAENALLTATSVNDANFSIFPTFAISRSTPRQQETLTYSPSFMFYQPTSVLDTVDQGAALTFQDRLSPTFALSLQDSFYRTSDVFDQSYLFSAGGITGSTQTLASTVIAPFGQQLNNIANAVISYQFGRDGMVGGGGFYSIADFSSSANASGISNSSESDASAFYNRRLSRAQYIGFDYQYSRTISELMNQQSETQTHSLLPFYTFYFAKAFSVSVSAGAQHVYVTLPQSLTSDLWSPSAVVSVGWQTIRAYIAANYTHTVNSWAGLFGAFTVNSFGASGGWKVARLWTAGLSVYYTNTTNATPVLITLAGGTTIAGQASVTHSLGEHFTASCGYQRLHQEYPDILIISENPDSNQEYGRIAYEFRKPLGR